MRKKSVFLCTLLGLVLSFSACDDKKSSKQNNQQNNINNINNLNALNNLQLLNIEVVPPEVMLEPGETAQMEALGMFDDGETRNITAHVNWVSDNLSVAGVSATGLVTAVETGFSTVSASLGDLVGESAVTVRSNVVEPTLADVFHEREFRGVWIATAWGINFPSSTSSADAQKVQIQSILDAVEDFGLNAVVFQVRPESDAFYASDLEPWSRFLTGTQGQNPGYDPLSYLIEQAHARNIEVHAWLNPYRALVTRTVTTASNHISKRFPQYAYPWGDSLLWMDPGATVVRDHIVDVVADIVRRYDVDGIHFDDYFYPWPTSGYTFPDGPLHQAYLNNGGTMNLADWRRDNVNQMVRLVSEAVFAEKPHVRFGVGPFGIYRTGEPPGITGTSQYDVLYSDPKKWILERWVDYIAPQLYWPTTSSGQPYGTLLPWWAGISPDGHYIFAGNALYRLGDNASWTVDEFRLQVQIGRQYRQQHSMGNIFYHVTNIVTNKSGVASMLFNEFYHEPALTPPVVAVRDITPAHPWVTADGTLVTVDHDQPDTIRAWIVYAASGEDWVIERIVPSTQTSFQLPAGRWAISAANLGNVESRGFVIQIGQ